MKPATLSAAGLLLLAVLGGGLPGADPKKPPRSKEDALRLFAEEFVPLTPGKERFPASFTMGSAADAPASEKPAHTVTFRQPFAMARYEVTQELYLAVTGKDPSKWKGPRNSVEMVSWDESVDFCRKATDQLRQRKLIRAGEEIRLPTEAEWEYACRAGTETTFSFGDKEDLLPEFGWFTGNAKGNDPPVGAKKANPWGLYDMHGYLWEWCQDAWHAGYQGAPADGSAWEEKEAKERVLRGGSWKDAAAKCRSASRHHQPAATQDDAIGLRCVLAPAKQP
jgi:formylglycine-generating enzyme required for sulfatase activity